MRRRRQRARQSLFATAALASLAGCGTTVSGVAPGTAAGTGGLGVATPPAGATGATVGGSLPPSATGSAGQPAGAAGLSGPSSPAGLAGLSSGHGDGLSQPGGQPLATSNAPGITATSISVGIPYSVNGAAANAAIGAAGITQGDERGEYQALIDDVNKHGGILGRKLVPVWHEYDALSTGTADSAFEAMCADFTQDHHVFAMFTGGSSIIERCAQRSGAVAIYENLSNSSARTFRQFPAYVEISMFALDRAVLNEAIGLEAQNYFAPWDATNGRPAAVAGATKVGIVGLDTPDFHQAIDGALQPQLRRNGHAAAPADVVYLAPPKRTSDLGALSAAAANAIVKFRQDGVEHVLVIDVDGTLTLEFLNQAESQHYYPRYGWNSQNVPQALVGPGNVQPDQLRGSMGIGYWPGIDLAASDDLGDGRYSNPQRRSCLSFMKAHGFSFSDSNAEMVALLLCNQVRFFQTVMNAAAAPISQATFIAAVNSLGGSFESATAVRTFFGPTQHDGGAAYYHYQWNPDCGCMRYSGGIHRAVG